MAPYKNYLLLLLCNDQCWAGQLRVLHVEKINIGIFLTPYTWQIFKFAQRYYSLSFTGYTTITASFTDYVKLAAASDSWENSKWYTWGKFVIWSVQTVLPSILTPNLNSYTNWTIHFEMLCCNLHAVWAPLWPCQLGQSVPFANSCSKLIGQDYVSPLLRTLHWLPV